MLGYVGDAKNTGIEKAEVEITGAITYGNRQNRKLRVCARVEFSKV